MEKMQRSMPLVPIQLDSSVAVKMNMGGSMFQEKSLMSRTDTWHQIKIIQGAFYDTEDVLNAILDAVEPADIIPVKYKRCGDDTCFIAKNCGPALEKLCKSNLIVKNPKGDPFVLVVTLGYASLHDIKMGLQPLLLSMLAQRYNSNRKQLDLTGFHCNPEVRNVVYCPLFQKRTFVHLLKLAKNTMDTIEHLNLQHNRLYSIAGIETSTLDSIKYLDLRHNNLTNMDSLAPLKSLPITKLWLDSNPLCENYSTPVQYIESAKRYCPNLVQLDGVFIGGLGMPFVHASYFKNQSRLDLVEKFLDHFFTLYDQNDRTMLKGLYHEDAYYSLSFGIHGSVANRLGLGQFTASRNILRPKESFKKKKKVPQEQLHLYRGHDIITGLRKLPRCYHDRSSFVCDLMYDDGKCLVFTVGGLLKKFDPLAQILTFSRTFVLVAGRDNEYNIRNDQYYVTGAPEQLTPEMIDPPSPTFDKFVPNCFSSTDKHKIMSKFAKTTTLVDEWCESYLQEARWDIRKAIANFIKDHKTHSVPPEAFR